MPRQPLTVAGGGSLDLWVRVPRVEQPGAFRSVRWIFASFYLLVVLIHEDDAGVIILQVFWGELGITDDDHQVARADQARGGAIDADDTGSPLTGDHVGGQAIAVVDIHDVDLLPLEQIRGLHEVCINGAGAHIVEIRLGDGGPVDFGFQHGAQHVAIPYSVAVPMTI